MATLLGAKIICDFRKNNLCTKEEGERLLSFTNNSGPLFIIGTVGTSLFYDTRTGILLLLTHIFACITVGCIFRFWKISITKNKILTNKNPDIKLENNLNFSNFGDFLGKSILSSINTLLLIGGFIVFFSVIISIIKSSNIINLLLPICNTLNIDFEFLKSTLLGFIEITNGIQMISKISTPSMSLSIILCSFLLGFGGLSVLFQVSSIVAKSDISLKPYIIGKLLHGFISSFYTLLILKYTHIFSLDFNSSFISNTNILIIPILILFILIITFRNTKSNHQY